ncbi:DUF1826 domain-containing protein [Paraglaciecola chathamensis]|uniref:DUF1826 domain-containing protein n=1 Tax=Paraglaciecola chathamensis TaxID=368405 RepID=A0ABS0WII3_9ALTE|nr:DUF1826 domain-containing protein [Paraglaciecola chathamensis]MBJ2138238.1 DUF1826 domain-containing protein [Paraglaciecola chathamensis]
MSIATPLHNQAHGIEHHANDAFGNMTYSQGSDFSVLPDIYQDNHNLVIWQRTLSDELIAHVTQCIAENPRLNLEKGIAANAIADDVNAALTPLGFNEELIENIASLVDMFCCLFDLKRAGLRLKVLEQAMCPRFHVDWVPCRLVTTFSGTGTQWIPHHKVDRTKLGTGNNGFPDDKSGLYCDASAIQELSSGDVALLKGEGWEDNEGAGLVHRSPPNNANEKRLLLTLDFIS